MKEISMHILDIVMNSIKAGATLIEINIYDSIKNNCLIITIKDNGIGMSSETAKLVTDPFFTTRTTRKVGLGIPMLKEACERCNGSMEINSEIGKGTVIKCCFERNNIDRAPLGNMGDTIMTIVNSLEECELIYNHKTDEGTFSLNTTEVREVLDGASIKSGKILLWVKEYVNENIKSISII
ncbi:MULTISPECIES: ATP-binding protein [unclassified Sedimentibacter]|uniref:ATP-binding protein n=1 Tax=unclassified Sedimentibacter TaxID=2649220 RepID=UPI0027E01A07|nr:ATP-binding protein [Sedimentibacter sp. MB35-C1]WMJ75900.1 ATP-binding protein [Sedimentibacter sp. MB35-C1]